MWEHGQPRAWRPLSPVWGAPLSSCHRFLRHPEATPWPVRGRGEMRRRFRAAAKGAAVPEAPASSQRTGVFQRARRARRGTRAWPAPLIPGVHFLTPPLSHRLPSFAREQPLRGARRRRCSKPARSPRATSPRPARWPRGPRPGLGEGQLSRDNKQFFRWYELETNHIRI